MTDRVEFEQPETGPTPPEQPAPVDPNRPAWLPEQFKTPEDFAKSWADQRAEITRLQQGAKKPSEEPPKDPEKPAEQKPEETPPEKKPEEQNKSQDDAAKEVADAAGVDLAPYQEEYNSTGDVSEENREKIAEGLKKVLGENARSIVDDFIEARKVVHQNDQKLFMDSAGGAENYAQMTQWAAQSLPKEQVEAYNRTVQSGDRHATLLAIEGLKAKFEAANGKAPRLLTGGGGYSSEPAFKSTAEMVTAMNDPRYKTDQAYRDQVARRLAASQF